MNNSGFFYGIRIQDLFSAESDQRDDEPFNQKKLKETKCFEE